MALTTELVTLTGGLAVPLPALQLLWDLEARGFTLLVDDDGLIVRPRARITPADDRAIRQHRDELIALVRYCDSPPELM
jgi:hypothetical protein